jgi:hypothetical protein
MAKKPHKIRRPKYEISEKQLDKIKYEVSKEATQKACLLCVGAMADTLKLNEDQICEVSEDITRWAMNLEEHILTLNNIADIIEKRTGIKFSRYGK